MKHGTPPSDPFGKLAELDERIESSAHGPLSLNPAASRCTSLLTLVTALAEPGPRTTLALGTHHIVAALIDSFPQNLFWDLDYLIASVHRDALLEGDYEAGVRERAELLARLMSLHGRGSVIRFRYAHDFVYGFDWARWVRRDPAHRAQTAPFDLTFMRQSEKRGRHLMELIAADDERYPKLATGKARNPFPFSRKPEQELRLWPLLAEEGSIPVRAWDPEGKPAWDQDFDALREDAADRLGF